MKTANHKKSPLPVWAGMNVALALSLLSTQAFPIGVSFDSTVGGYTQSNIFTSVQDYQNQDDAGAFDNISNLFETTLAASTATLDIGGVDVIAQSSAGSTDINLSIPSIGFNQTFSAGNRSASWSAMTNYLGNNYKSLLSKMFAKSPLSSVAGSPTSGLMWTSASNDFNIGQGQDISANGGFGNDTNKASFAARFGTSTIGSNTINTFSLPLGYTWNFKNGFGIVTSVPLTYVETLYQDKVSVPSYQASLGIGLRIPFNHLVGIGNRWDLTPIFRVGATGSDKDYTSIGLVYSGGLLSEYYLSAGDYDISIRNMGSYYTTVPISVGGYSTALLNNVDNYLFKNGIRVSRYISIPGIGDHLFGRSISASAWFTDTRITGSNLFVHNAQEVGMDIGLLAKKASSDSSFAGSQLAENEVRIGLAYTHASGVNNAFNATLGLSF